MGTKLKLILVFTLLLFLSGCEKGCSFDSAVAEVESWGCGAMGEEKADHCWQDAGVRSSDSSYCEKIVDPAPKSKCYLRIAGKVGKTSYCEDMPSGKWAYSKEECYQLVAVKQKDTEACYKISDTYSKSRSDMTTSGVSGVSREECDEEARKYCGNEDQKCCTLGNLCNSPSLGCDMNSERSVCISSDDYGTAGKPCPPNGLCYEGFTCSSSNMCVTACGGQSESCCGGDKKDFPCRDGLKCNIGQTCTSYECGRAYQQPCPGMWCKSGLIVHCNEYNDCECMEK